MTDEFAGSDTAFDSVRAGQYLFCRVCAVGLSLAFIATGATCIVHLPDLQLSSADTPPDVPPNAGQVINLPKSLALRAFARTLIAPAEPPLLQVTEAPQSPPSPAENAAAKTELVNAPMQPEAEMASRVPLPVPRPRDLDVQNEITAAANVVSEETGVLEKLLGWPKSSGTALAYAAPEAATPNAPVIEDKQFVQGDDKLTAVYVISTRTVYMPNGTKLEAHSGMGDLLDDPEHVHVRMRGATPPAVYELKPREKPFHGVQALRLSPISKSNPLGRTGLLAHPFMLGPNGDSNGCVSIRDYKAFLEAYDKGQVKRLAVIARLD